MEARRTRPRWPDVTPAPVTPVSLILEQVELTQYTSWSIKEGGDVCRPTDVSRITSCSPYRALTSDDAI